MISKSLKHIYIILVYHYSLFKQYEYLFLNVDIKGGSF